METKQDFKNHFFSIANFLGSKANKLYEQIGKYDDIDKDEHRAYVWFNNSKASFYVDNNDIIGWVSAPLSDAYGHKYLEEPEYFSIDGVHQGMIKENVLSIWGEPDWKAERMWGYSNKGGSTFSNQNFELCVGFDDNEGEFKVTYFEARIIESDESENQSNLNKSMYNTRFEDIYARAADFLGYTESELKSIIGQPDKEFPGDAPNEKYFIYSELEIGLGTNSSGIINAMVCPYEPNEQKIYEGYYDVLGLKIGDNVDRVYQMWGTPSKVHQDALIYNSTLGKTSRGDNYFVELTIEDGLLKWFNCILISSNIQKPKSGCFVATACYGDYNSEEVLVLREFRDNVLLNSLSGKIFVKFYYFISPPIAKFIEKSSILKTFIRKWFLSPIIRNLKKP